MANLIAKFTPSNSSKRYAFELSPKADLKTVIKQFQLDLPGKYDLKDMRLRLLNGIDPKSDPKMNAIDFFKALLLLQSNRALKDDEFNCVYVTKKQLTTIRIRNAFKNKSSDVTEINYQPYWFYIFKEPVTTSKTAVAAQAKEDTEPALVDITDFATLQSRALKIEREMQDLQQGAANYKQVMEHADEVNMMLTKQLEDLDHDQQKDDTIKQKQHEFLKKNFENYLQTDSQKMMFIINLLQNPNAPAIQKITKGKTSKLFNLVKAVCDYD